MSAPSLFDLIDRLIAGLPLAPDKVAQALDARLVRDPDSDTAATRCYALPATVKGGRYESVDLRMPDEDIGEASVFLSVTPRSDEGLDEAAIGERFGDDFRAEVPSPRFPPGAVPKYLIYQKDWGTLSFGVTPDGEGRLVRFVLDARLPPPRQDEDEGDDEAAD